jgi:hypothetical protein
MHVRSGPRQLRSESTQTAPHSCTFPTLIHIPPLLLHHRCTNTRDTDTRYPATAALHVQAQACAFVIRPRRRHARLDSRQSAPPARVAQPDSCLGYITTGDARNTGTKAPFSTDDEAILHTFSLTPYMHFPFLTAQWKVPNSSENLHSAQNQAARDGAAVVNQLHDLYTTVDSTPPSPVQTCHFSVQTDLQHGGLWVHWRDGHNHYMELEYDFSMRDEVALGNLRGFLRNILNNATGPRLESIKTALPNFIDSQTCGDYPVVLPAGEDESARSESAASLPRSLSGSQFQFKPPPTPSSTTSDPQKSRKRARHGSIT